MSFNGNDIVIVRRGEDVDNGDDETCVTVVDNNGISYLLGFSYDDEVLTINGAGTEVVPDGYERLHVAYQSTNVPEGNWLLLKWLKDNYNFSFENSAINLELSESDFEDDQFITRCNNGALEIRGYSSESYVWQGIYEDGIYDYPDGGFLNCNGTFESDIPQPSNSLEVQPLENLSEESSEYSIKAAYRLLILALRGLVTIPW